MTFGQTYVILPLRKMKITNFVTSLTRDKQLSVCCAILLRVFKQQAAGLLQAEPGDERHCGECPAGIYVFTRGRGEQ